MTRRKSAEKLYKTYFDFSGGQDNTSSPDNVKDNSCVYINNFDIIFGGGLESRPGTVDIPLFGSVTSSKN